MLVRRAPKAFTLIEVLIAAAVMATMIAGAASALATSWRFNQYMREEAAALRAAERILAAVRATGADANTRIVDSPSWVDDDNSVDGVNSGGWMLTDDDAESPASLAGEVPVEVQLLRGHGRRMGLVSGETVFEEAEVVVITSEAPNESDYGRDLDGDGLPDGVDLNGDNDTQDTLADQTTSLFALGLDGDDTLGEDLSADPTEMKLVPVVIIVRWRSLAQGLEGRVQLMSVISEEYDGG